MGLALGGVLLLQVKKELMVVVLLLQGAGVQKQGI